MNPNSEMDPLEPIPSPPGHLVREFCHRVLPVLTFVAAIIGVATLWNQRVTGSMLFGEVEPIRVNVVTPDSGTFLQVHVQRWQEVTNGQPIATLQTLDPDAAQQELEILRSEINVLRSRTTLDEARNEQDLEALRVRALEARVDLARTKVVLDNARREFDRTRSLFDQNIVGASALDSARTLQESLQVEVEERAKLVEGLESSIRNLAANGSRGSTDNIEILNRSLAAREKQLTSKAVLVLRSPRAGIIKSLPATVGERAAAGAIIAEVSSARSERIVGYVRQPATLDPVPGMKVEIRTRGVHRQTVTSEIVQVGNDFELVDSPLRLRGFDNATERGLAFAVSIPPTLNVHPGELVDLVVSTRRGP